jgi:serine/threonine protein kinase
VSILFFLFFRRSFRKNKVGTPLYCAPEILEGTGYSRSVDLWAMGVVMYQMLLGFTPFEVDNEDFGQLIRNILSARVLYPSDMIDHTSRSLLTQLLQRDPKLRLDSFDEIRHHEFFDGIEFDRLLLKKVKSPFNLEISSDDDVSYYEIRDTDGIANEFENLILDAASTARRVDTDV